MKKINKTFEYDRISDLEQFKNGHYVEEDNILDFSRVTSDEWVFVSGDEEKVFMKPVIDKLGISAEKHDEMEKAADKYMTVYNDICGLLNV